MKDFNSAKPRKIKGIQQGEQINDHLVVLYMFDIYAAYSVRLPLL